MRQLAGELVSLAAWYLLWIRAWLRQAWRDLPGPWPVKVLLIALCFAIPGPWDEIALLTLARAGRAWRAARADA